MTHRRQFLQAAAVTPFAIAATPYKVKPSWYIGPEKRRQYGWFPKWFEDKVRAGDKNWSPAHSVVGTFLNPAPISELVEYSNLMAYAKASALWDLGEGLDTPVGVAVNGGIVHVTVNEVLSFQSASEHPALQYSKELFCRLSPQEIAEQNGFQLQPIQVGSVIHSRKGLWSCVVGSMTETQMWVSASAKSLWVAYSPNPSNWWVIPESIPNQKHKFKYGDLAVTTLSVLRERETLDDAHRAFQITSSLEGHNTVRHTSLEKNDYIYGSNDLVYIGHDPRPQVIWENLEVSA